MSKSNNKPEEIVEYTSEQIGVEEAFKDVLNSRKELKEDKLSKKEVQEVIDSFVNPENATELAKELLNEKYGKMTIFELAKKLEDPIIDQMQEKAIQESNEEREFMDKLKEKTSEMLSESISNRIDVYNHQWTNNNLKPNMLSNTEIAKIALKATNKINGGKEMKEYKYLNELLEANGEEDLVLTAPINTKLNRTLLASGKLVDKYDSFIEIISVKGTGEIITVELKDKVLDEDKSEDNNGTEIIEDYEVSLQDQLDTFENQEEAIQEKINQLNEELDEEYRSMIYKIPVKVSNVNGELDDREFVHGENCLIISFDIFGGALILNMNLEPAGTVIRRDMESANQTIIVLKSNDEESDTYEMTIGNIIDSGLGCWYDYKKDALYMTPLEWMGMKLFQF